MRMGVLEHLGIAQAPAWLFAAELREGTVVRLLIPYERTVPNPCGSTCKPPAVDQSTDLHRTLGEDFRALHPVQSAVGLKRQDRVCRKAERSLRLLECRSSTL